MAEAEIPGQMNSPVDVPESSDTRSDIVYGSYVDRFGAFLIDMLIFLPVAVTDYCLPSLSSTGVCGFVNRTPYLYFVLILCYFSVAEYVWGRSLGKACFGLRVRSENGGKINIAQAIVRRALFLWVSHIWLLVIDAIGVFIPAHRQRFSDRAAKTIVVRDTRISSRRRWLSWVFAVLVAASVIALARRAFQHMS